MKRHYKAHVCPLSCIPQKAQAPLQIKLDTLTAATDTLMLFHRMGPWKTTPGWSDVDDDDNDNNNNND